ncbi:bifunctional proline dehydrogenase/L-glutamate gamma-semialdehyde dehydrogenase PutA [Glaesserella parasuis]|uniref:bifunctional proline dehydrogenase/L-glutamate gamma-semialdehyde dehydrogenase PutA n=1 Tax=Glaesserella parasuis TaxID=738 RepID=UPI001310841E|nr:bifunctional proline dehydrogenase/L-glutamate gamma-semialdehyde dehydrogenase PutA [Glaesserella parasuis]MDG6324702.1 bifunctional proline dehydrogenase/L-glutamate gamma-semialdehyde dehydrogenase PutA [Glaesserella parasuis]MDG6454521.1 bifunctional proline dehydrogenase/L-glutamate gamma-semialdehyde dehydrogenase PutA [Glaesserella parasuis]MDG6480486.1 bifunctional proline dehydrogenase/L-glutamate gamma-semialdehyde dehydrogenase PutA [Glaesserella parasuis]MDP0070942.1 bifunctional
MSATSHYHILPQGTAIRPTLSEHYRCDEEQLVKQLIPQARVDEHAEGIKTLTKKLVEKVRNARQKASGVDALMHEFSLSSEEGVALMCLAEALLRIPDKATADKLIRDKIAKGDWRSHVGNSPSLFVNAAAWGLVVTGKLVATHSESSLASSLSRLIQKGGEPLIRKGVDVAMRLLGKQFVTGETIQQAIKNGEKRFAMGYRYSYDMLGEAAFTEQDAKRYYDDYVASIHAVGAVSRGLGVYKSSGVSVKLSAIHPRYSLAQHKRVIDELYPRLKDLFLLAKQYDIGLNIDAEEADRLELSLDLMDRLIADPDLADFAGIGFVVQAYQKRCPYVIDYLIEKARANHRKLMIRLVKGAYWDSEVKRAQADGAEGYPVFSRKVHTDLNYVVCAKKLLSAQDVIYPQFATHNAQTLSTIYHLAQGKHFEFQCLHGMGETLYDEVVGSHNLNVQCRIYAPVGSYQTLLAYLVRRLLENGANSSFVNQIVDENLSIDDLACDPVAKAQITEGTMHPKIPLPVKLFAEQRQNSKGYDLTDAIHLKTLEAELNQLASRQYRAEPQIAGEKTENLHSHQVHNPANIAEVVGEVIEATENDVAKAFAVAEQFKAEWQNTSPIVRAEALEKMADLMEANMPQLFDLAVREAGKTLNNAIAEVREAVDFCRYYAKEVRQNPEGYRNPRGIVVAISPWNFPLAIFVGEVSSALVAGNVVLAKPAEQTSLMAYYAVSLFHQAGIPEQALQCLTGSGKVIGSALVSDPRVNGVIFTGSTDTAKNINRNLQKSAHIVPLIAETGGQNAMIVDSSALGEQVVADILNSAFDSAGQRCSALRVLYLQRDVAEHILTMLKGAMAELKVGRPQNLNTDVGPVIDKVAQERLLNHIDEMKKVAKSCYQVPIDPQLSQTGIFVPPTLLEIEHINQLKHEVFGPVLHVIRFDADNLPQVMADINSTGFGLTSGLHSRIDETVDLWLESIYAGNLYVNRNTVGAVVGVQPFGGMGLSGTGPKAGGPLYLQRLVNRCEWTLSGLEGGKPADTSGLLTGIQAVLSGTELQNAQDLIASLSRQSPLGKVFKMQGITGEVNFMQFEARPVIAIGNGSLEQQIQALIAVVVSGSRAAVHSNSPLAKQAQHFAGLVIISNDFNSLANLSSLIVLEPLSLEEKAHYAERTGAILTYVENLDLALSLFPLLHEKAISINTAAAGGNASLMSEMD